MNRGEKAEIFPFAAPPAIEQTFDRIGLRFARTGIKPHPLLTPAKI
jgi:hypothetical protein